MSNLKEVSVRKSTRRSRVKYFKREFRSLQPNNIETSTKNIRNCNGDVDSDGDGRGTSRTQWVGYLYEV